MKLFKSITSPSSSGSSAATPTISFDVQTVDDRRKQAVRLALSGNGLAVTCKDRPVWSAAPADVHIQCDDANPARFTINVVHRYQFEADDHRQMTAILDAFQGLELGQFQPQARPRSLSGTPPSPINEEAVPADPDPMLGVDDFIAIRVLGEGSFGQVQLVERKSDGRRLAMKIIPPCPEIDAQIEVQILNALRHPFIVSMVCAFMHERRLHICMEYIESGDLGNRMVAMGGRFDESIVRFITAEVVLALDYLHQAQIAYRDLKPDNILVAADGHIRLVDMGLAKQGISSCGGQTATGTKSGTFCGTPAYQAPEILLGIEHGFACDYWSLGVLVYELLTGVVPFFSMNRNQMYNNAIKAELTFPVGIGKEAQSFIRGLLVRRPEDRLGSGPLGVNEIKSHPFLRDNDWMDLEQGRICSPLAELRTQSDAERCSIGPKHISTESFGTADPAAHKTLGAFIDLVRKGNNGAS